jgi:hypothetical protein
MRQKVKKWYRSLSVQLEETKRSTERRKGLFKASGMDGMNDDQEQGGPEERKTKAESRARETSMNSVRTAQSVLRKDRPKSPDLRYSEI